MKRIGVDGEGYDNLSAEFQASLGKVTSLLKDIAEGAPEEVRRSQTGLFFNLTRESLDRLVALLSDLAIVKNWVLDGKQIPQQPASE
jgi:signal transduction histidine kinase